MTSMEKLKQLRALMKTHAIDAYIVPRGDEYLGEFVAPYAERLKYLTNFTGSAGHAVIMQDKAYVMSDGRYTLQLTQQIDTEHFTPENSIKHPLKDWLYDQLQEGQVIGFDPWLHSIEQIEGLNKRLKAKNITLKAIDDNLIDQIWNDQPAKPNKEAIDFPESIAGQSSAEKISLICRELAEQEVEHAILTLPDSIGWLLNIRGSDIDYTPIKQTYAYVDVVVQNIELIKNSDLKCVGISNCTEQVRGGGECAGNSLRSKRKKYSTRSSAYPLRRQTSLRASWLNRQKHQRPLHRPQSPQNQKRTRSHPSNPYP